LIRNIIVGQIIARVVAFLISIGVPKSVAPEVKPTAVEWPQKYEQMTGPAFKVEP